jgi:hypothetical protein
MRSVLSQLIGFLRASLPATRRPQKFVLEIVGLDLLWQWRRVSFACHGCIAIK